MRLFPMLLLLAACAAAPGRARATVGGESLCDVLGYETATGRVYFHQQDGGGGDSFGCVAWLETRGPDAGRLGGAGWGRPGEGSAQDPGLARRLAALRSSLTPLERVNWPTLPTFRAIVAADSVPNPHGVSRRLEVAAGFGGAPDLRAICWGSPEIARPAVYALPDGEGWVWVIAFFGDNSETGYETQMPMLWRRDAGREATVVAWRRWID